MQVQFYWNLVWRLPYLIKEEMREVAMLDVEAVEAA